MANYVAIVAGRLRQIAATVVSAGVASAGAIPALDANGRLDNSVLPVGIGADTAVIQTSEALAAGDFVNVHDGGAGVFRVRKADATTNGRPAHGFVLSAFASGANATVYFEGTNNQVTGQTPGFVYLTTTPGIAGATAPAAAGNIAQQIGVAISATAINFDPLPDVELV